VTGLVIGQARREGDLIQGAKQVDSSFTVPLQERPRVPAGYGVPSSVEGTLPWAWAVERLEGSRNYWFSTTRPDGRPHAMPAWAVWLDGALFFEGSPQTRRARNIAANPEVVVHLESGDDVVILQGRAEPVGKPERALAERLAAAFGNKYAATHDYRPTPEQWDEGGLWAFRPRIAFGWNAFPVAATRWRFVTA
jgi:nitroimidazol reductase NimA-like FMN-containing flavoprotein (pyridoxamine 5'-phosphate oxidase superfamily)